MTDNTLNEIQEQATPAKQLADLRQEKKHLEEANTKASKRIKEIMKTDLLPDDQKEAKIEEVELEINERMQRIVEVEHAITTVGALIKKEGKLNAKRAVMDGVDEDDDDPYVKRALDKIKNSWLKENPNAHYIIEDGKFGYIKDYSVNLAKQNVQYRTMDASKFAEELAADLSLKSWHIPPHRLKDLFNECQRTFKMARYSLDDTLWHKKHTFLPLVEMKPYFIDKLSETVGDDYHEAFDWLMYSLSGASKENQDHIEQWILHKVINYHKATTTPDIMIIGHVGGNGKGILQSIVRMMFPATLSGKANSKTLNGNFNAILLGKLIVFFDDQNSKEIPLEVVKQLAGSDTMVVELKGKDQYEGEKTHSSAWFNNRVPIPLTPGGKEGGVDRRFSIMRTNITFLESLRHHIKNEDGSEMSVETSKDIAERIVTEKLMDRNEIARWFNALRKKHPQVDSKFTLKALHGADYHHFLKMQLGSSDDVWNELVMPVIQAGGCVPVFAIKEVLRHMEGKVINDKAIVKKMVDLANQNKLEIDSFREYITIESDKNLTPSKKQCAVLRQIDPAKWTDHSFDWGLISNAAYSVSPGKPLIEEDNFILGLVRDDPESLFVEE